MYKKFERTKVLKEKEEEDFEELLFKSKNYINTFFQTFLVEAKEDEEKKKFFFNFVLII